MQIFFQYSMKTPKKLLKPQNLIFFLIKEFKYFWIHQCYCRKKYKSLFGSQNVLFFPPASLKKEVSIKLQMKFKIIGQLNVAMPHVIYTNIVSKCSWNHTSSYSVTDWIKLLVYINIQGLFCQHKSYFHEK